MLTVGFAKTPTRDLASWLLTKHHIHVTTALRAGVTDIGITRRLIFAQLGRHMLLV